MMHLHQLLAEISPGSSFDKQVSGFALDNRLLKPGMVFVALQGTQQHGLSYAKAAVEAGAVAILYESVVGLEVPECQVPVISIDNLENRLGEVAAAFYANPSRAMNMVGVTGTDGKTSVTHFIAEAVQALGKNAAVIGTIGIGQPGALQTATHTTPDAISTHTHLSALQNAGTDTVAMEVSSHALDQGRVNGVDFDIAVLTNLTRDHLDYHRTEAAYANAKRKLFHWTDLRAAVLNLDDAFGRELATELAAADIQTVGYGVGDVDAYPTNTIVATQASFDHNGICAQITSPWGKGELKAAVLGRFNLDNLLATLSVLLLQGYEFSAALHAIAQVQTVPGRMERVSIANQDSDFLTVVDYAHTSGALASVLSAVKAHTQHELICVFGCGGDRDTGKRPLMAQAAEQGADQVIVTDDNPRNEDSAAIFADIRQGFRQPEGICFEHDRSAAIRAAISRAQAGDTVLIAGKGHESVQIVQQENHPFDDREQARKALREYAA